MKIDRDLGAYVFGCNETIISDWFKSKFGLPQKVVEIVGGSKFYTYSRCCVVLTQIPQYSIEVTVSPSTKDWPESVFLGRSISRELGVKVLCEPGAEYPNCDPLGDELLEIFNGRETIVFVDQDDA